MNRWLLVALAVIGPPALLLQVAMFAANGFWVGLFWLLLQTVPALCWWGIHHHTTTSRRHAAIVARAHYEHAQLCRGNIAVGTYGAYQPPDINR